MNCEDLLRLRSSFERRSGSTTSGLTTPTAKSPKMQTHYPRKAFMTFSLASASLGDPWKMISPRSIA